MFDVAGEAILGCVLGSSGKPLLHVLLASFRKSPFSTTPLRREEYVSVGRDLHEPLYLLVFYPIFPSNAESSGHPHCAAERIEAEN